MSDIINILPDNVANQIAAGEVVQRPASVVKELVENAIDAGATSVTINLTDSGKTLIQIIDNGCGMSQTDARIAFERHATSKIKNANDLFAIRSMGFRGEALASIAAIAHVELKTKQVEEELGNQIIINGGEFVSQKSIACASGSNFLVKDLFFNVPARRKFLKANSTELRNIITEFHRFALSNPDIAFKLINNDAEIFNLPATNQRQRIINIFGKSMNNRLVSIDTKTSIVNISGFIGKPKNAKRTTNEQFFFVNKRFMRHPYFYKAVLLGYEKILSPDTLPPFFINFEVDPNIIDINIHPTKTEIKFEDEQSVFQIIQAAVRESLGKFNIVPSIDFDEDNSLEIPSAKTDEDDIEAPSIEINTSFNPFDSKSDYNPFEMEKAFNPFESQPKMNDNSFYEEFKPKEQAKSSNTSKQSSFSSPKVDKDWQKLYEENDTQPKTEHHAASRLNFEQESNQNLENNESSEEKENNEPVSDQSNSRNLFQLKNKYILTQVKSGLMLVDQRKAHERILFEKFLKSLENRKAVIQKLIFPQTIDLNPIDFHVLESIVPQLEDIGFELERFGTNTYSINGYPADINSSNPKDLLEKLLANYQDHKSDLNTDINTILAKSMAKASAINYGKKLSAEEMGVLIDELFACKTPNFAPDGKSIISVMDMNEIEKRF
ncbi:MAG: DNA mismatch repair endonuclease MutL [Marinifilaceae bacterium]|jgi:DNA mismatch repair protein MutL|nr:DNA mismatch repair endonuclease MutL [Marinifilaceae bacterium]